MLLQTYTFEGLHSRKRYVVILMLLHSLIFEYSTLHYVYEFLIKIEHMMPNMLNDEKRVKKSDFI